MSQNPPLSRTFEQSLDEELRELFRDLAAAVRYIDFRDKIPADRFRALVNLVIYDRWWPGESEENVVRWLGVEQKDLASYRESEEYEEILAVAEALMEELASTHKYAEWIERPEVQDRLARTHVRLLRSPDEKVREKAVTSLTDRIQPRLTKGQERHEVHTVIQISDGFARRLLETDEQVKQLDVVDSDAVLLPAPEEDPGEVPA